METSMYNRIEHRGPGNESL